MAKARSEVAERDRAEEAGLSVAGLQRAAVAVQVVRGQRCGDGIPPVRRSASALRVIGSANASGIARRTLVGRTRTAIPRAAPQASAQPTRLRALIAQRTAARVQKIAVASLIG